MRLSKTKTSSQVLLIEPKVRGGWEVSHPRHIDFGNHTLLNHNDLRLPWFNRFLKGLGTEVADWTPVKILVIATGDGKINCGSHVNQVGPWCYEEDSPMLDKQPRSLSRQL